MNLVIEYLQVGIILNAGGLSLRATTQSLMNGVGSGWKHHFNQYLYFSVSDLDESLNLLLSAGGELTKGIETMPWGEMMFYAKDPFGNPISFVAEETLFLGMDESA